MHKRTKNVVIAGILGLFSLFLIGVPSFLSLEQLPSQVPGVEIPGSKPMMCIGFNMQKSEFGAEWGTCPANHAFYGVDDPAGVAGPAEKISSTMSCCPLPSNDILTEEHVYVADECPVNYVATGSLHKGEGKNMQHFMRCTKINSDRYQLAESQPAKYWGDGAAGWNGAARIRWENIPAGMRYAHGREGQQKWDVDGCVGYPWGSLLTKKETKYCSGFRFRQLQFKGALGDPQSGTPVKMFADCDEVNNINSPNSAACIKDNSITAARALPEASSNS